VAGRRLAERGAYVPQGVRLLLASSDLFGADRDGLVARFGEVADLLADRPVTAYRLADETLRRSERDARWAAHSTLDIAARLADRADPPSGQFAVALARQGYRYGWPASWRQLVHRLRAHPVADVQAAAFNVDYGSE
jgi:hypothetical protein